MLYWITFLARPAYEDFIKPKGIELLKPVMDITSSVLTPARNLYNGNLAYNEAVANFDNLITAGLRIARIACTYFILDAALKKGVRYFGNVGGAVVCLTIYSVGNVIDPKSNHSSAVVWLLAKGSIGLIKSWGTSLEAVGCLFFIARKEFLNREQYISSDIPGVAPLLNGVVASTARLMAKIFGYKEPSIPPSTDEKED